MIVALALAVGSTTLQGHHAFAAYYLEDQSLSIEGTLVEFDYLNPHAWVHIAAPDSSGQVRRVSGEWSNPGRLKAQGIDRDTLRPGDHLIMTGSPSRNPNELRLHLKRLVRPNDGWTWVGRGQRFQWPAKGFRTAASQRTWSRCCDRTADSGRRLPASCSG